MHIIFCNSLLDPKAVDPEYEREWREALEVGFRAALISYEALQENNPQKAVARIKNEQAKVPAIYRGWMLKPRAYSLLFDALLEKNIELINSPPQYQHCHYFPESYPTIRSLTPKSNWTPPLEALDFERIFKLTHAFGSSPIIVKDYVKSEKHHWKEACFIPDASDKENVKAVVEKFWELRGDYLNEGLVFRQFEALKPLTHHSKSGMPLTKEYRIFFGRSKIIQVFPYWEEGVYEEPLPSLVSFLEIAQPISSHFFTMDIAQKKTGEWIIMELGDGQVAGLPEHASTKDFYLELKRIFQPK